MRFVSILIAIFLICILSIAQDKDPIGDFTKSPTEHIINRVEKPFVVRSVKGIVIRKEGFREPLPGVLLEIQGPDADRKIRRNTTDRQGRFSIGHVPAGAYKFKATLDGFQSVIGNIIVSKNPPKTDEVKIEMATGV